MTSYPPPTPHWESRNGYVPPPRIQQLRARDSQQQLYQLQYQQQFNQGQQTERAQQNQAYLPPTPNPAATPPAIQGIPLQTDDMSHTRSGSFFSFHRNKQAADGQSSSAQQQSVPLNTNLPPPPNSFSASGPSTQGPLSPPPQNTSFAVQQQQQPSLIPQQQFNQQPFPKSQPLSPTPPQQPPQLQRPQMQPQQANGPSMERPTTSSPQSAVAAPVQGQGSPQPGAPPPLHPEIRSVVQLTIAHAHKIYFSGPLIRKFERQPDGQKPHKDEGWTEVWAQLGGTTLSIWDMKEIQEASKQGKEVPPSYINVTDAFVHVAGSITVPATATSPATRYTNMLTLNTAGSNLLLFSCPSTAALISWAAALRLAAWEKSRLEEIYTAHLIRITLNARDVPTTLVRGKTEGWTRIRIAGQTDWKRVWFVVQKGLESMEHGTGPHGPNTITKKRMSNLFSRETHASNFSGPVKPLVSMYLSPKPKDRKKPLLTMHSVIQAFGVYPERPELINRSTLIKIEGTYGDDELAGTLRSLEGWLLVMPELEANAGQAAEMLKWIVALHDAFELYGRPEAWTWDPRDPISLMFGYPVGPQKENLFLDREVVEKLDPREDRTSAIRSEIKKLLLTHMKPAVQAVQPKPPVQQDASDTPPTIPPINIISHSNQNVAPQNTAAGQPHPNSPLPELPRLPPLTFGSSSSAVATPSRDRPLTPITERSSIMTHARTTSADAPSMLNASQSPNQSLHPQAEQQPKDSNAPRPNNISILNGPLSDSPSPGSPMGFSSQQTEPAKTTDTTMANVNNQAQSTSVSTNPSTSSSFATSTEPYQGFARSSQDGRSPPTSPLASSSVLGSPPVPPPPPPQTQKRVSTSPTQEQSWQSTPKAFSNFLVNEARTRTQDTVSTQSTDARSLKLVSDADQRQFAQGNSWEHANVNQLQPPASKTARSSPTDEPNDFLKEAGALYYMQQTSGGLVGAGKRQEQQAEQMRGKQTDTSSADDTSDESDLPAKNTKAAMGAHPPLPGANDHGGSAPGSGNLGPERRSESTPFVDTARRSISNYPANMTTANGNDASLSLASPIGRRSPTRSNLGRKPSGARAQATVARSYNGAESISSQTVTEADETLASSSMPPALHTKQVSTSSAEQAFDDANGEALAALSYMAIADSEDLAASNTPSSPPPGVQPVEPLKIRPHAADSTTLRPVSSGENAPYKSSFAPSTKATERKLKAQAQQAAQHVATHLPGRANGKRKSRVAGAWESSEEEEDEEEEDDDDDDDDAPQADSDSQRPSRGAQSASSQNGQSTLGVPGRLPQLQMSQTGPSEYGQDGVTTPSHLRPARNLPQPPVGHASNNEFLGPQPIPRRITSDQYADRRTHYEDGTPIRSQAEFPAPGAARQTVWSQVLDPGRVSGRAPQPDQPAAPARDTFVQLEPSETMTKAFMPQGLLSAGLQDKEDRSARRQEEVARENGASLINVPNKPPPPQTGLLGAITAHERERKREGGVGAALTEREREKRLAEERQRRFDDHQRQQLDQMQQGGSMYGGQFGYNPMMANPMMMGLNPMMGMNPMMTGGGLNPMMTGGGMAPMNPMMTGQMAYPGMMGNFNPHLFAAQQAAQAYQQAMMAYSVAGSQVGGDGGGGMGASQLTPNMTGMPAMGAGFDPRMSMMGMPMMGMGMGMGMGGPGMGNPQIGGQAPLGMQMTGMSNFDPRSSPGGANDAGLQPPNQNQFSSRTSSPAGRGSPLARSSGPPSGPDSGRPSRPTSPR